MAGPLTGKVALVAGATRGAGRGTAVALGEAGATVYCTGRTTREHRSEYDRPETIEETAELVAAAGGEGIAVAVDHLRAEQVEALVRRIDADHGRLDVLVNDIWGGEKLIEWNAPVWEHDLEGGLRMLRLALETHLVTSHFALPLLIRRPGGLVVEMTDGTREYNDANYRLSTFYDLAKTAVLRLAFAQSKELAPHGCTAVALTPGWMRSEMMLDIYEVTEETWRDGDGRQPALPGDLGVAAVRRPGRRRARRRPRPGDAQRRLVLLRRPRARVRLHGPRRLAARLLALHGRGPGPRPAARRDRLPLIARTPAVRAPTRADGRCPPRGPRARQAGGPAGDAGAAVGAVSRMKRSSAATIAAASIGDADGATMRSCGRRFTVAG